MHLGHPLPLGTGSFLTPCRVFSRPFVSFLVHYFPVHLNLTAEKCTVAATSFNRLVDASSSTKAAAAQYVNDSIERINFSDSVLIYSQSEVLLSMAWPLVSLIGHRSFGCIRLCIFLAWPAQSDRLHGTVAHFAA